MGPGGSLGEMYGHPTCIHSICALEFALEVLVGMYLCQLVPNTQVCLVTAPTEPDLVLQERRINIWQIHK